MGANGPPVSTDCKFTGTNQCTLAGSWWLDVDAAEAANPDVFIGEPLTVQLATDERDGGGGWLPPSGTRARVSSGCRLA